MPGRSFAPAWPCPKGFAASGPTPTAASFPTTSAIPSRALANGAPGTKPSARREPARIWDQAGNQQIIVRDGLISCLDNPKEIAAGTLWSVGAGVIHAGGTRQMFQLFDQISGQFPIGNRVQGLSFPTENRSARLRLQIGENGGQLVSAPGRKKISIVQFAPSAVADSLGQASQICHIRTEPEAIQREPGRGTITA